MRKIKLKDAISLLVVIVAYSFVSQRDNIFHAKEKRLFHGRALFTTFLSFHRPPRAFIINLIRR